MVVVVDVDDAAVYVFQLLESAYRSMESPALEYIVAIPSVIFDTAPKLATDSDRAIPFQWVSSRVGSTSGAVEETVH